MTKVTGILHGHPDYTLYFHRVALGVVAGTFFLPQRYPVTTGPDGSFTIDLPPTDTSEIATTYRVTIPTDETSQVFEFSLPTSATPIPLTDLITL